MAKTCKYYKQQRQVSYDNGVTWINMDEYQKGALIEVNSSDCTSPSPKIYRWAQTEDTICVFVGKLIAEYSDGTTYGLECDGNSTLTTGNTHPSGYELSSMTDAVIGDCVTSIGASAFTECISLTSVTIGNNVTSIGRNAFLDCSGLTSVTIPNSVINIDYGAFARCSSLSNITIPNSVTTIGGYAFCCGNDLSTVTIPSSVTSIGDFAFNLAPLQSVTIEATTPPTLVSPQTFFTPNNDYPIYVPAESLELYLAAPWWGDSFLTPRIQAIP